jgi:hypothetical protein
MYANQALTDNGGRVSMADEDQVHQNSAKLTFSPPEKNIHSAKVRGDQLVLIDCRPPCLFGGKVKVGQALILLSFFPNDALCRRLLQYRHVQHY